MASSEVDGSLPSAGVRVEETVMEPSVMVPRTPSRGMVQLTDVVAAVMLTTLWVLAVEVCPVMSLQTVMSKVTCHRP